MHTSAFFVCMSVVSNECCFGCTGSCLSQPCYNGGTCQDDVFGYTCSCPDGLTGINCEIRLDLCMNYNCGPNGQCIDQYYDNKFSCLCDKGYIGMGYKITSILICICKNL